MSVLVVVSCSLIVENVYYRAQLHGGTRFVVRADETVCFDHTDTKYARMSILDFVSKAQQIAERTEREVMAPLVLFEEY